MAPHKYQPFKFIWDKYNWHAFFLRKERWYDKIYTVGVVTLVGVTIYQGVSTFQNWNTTLQRLYLHYVKKEKARKDLAELIRMARENGVLPPGDESFE
ncbi:conserved hypothetical protein [Neospora caninum Liverpool]|uniref:Uncharacterized protein n=1 Tax=Neospora caninum (strain Liverpool) TaxID=572307 RepID=F0VQQ7_NEOCL|nr:conserved hypothetical protein [Neospora caninum Liverpool]CBZ56054.1 conserved hypothetical protein [Neospora caninum Liverpool]CEL70802.1 TPA: hypothetical protein BN1204_064800 [Neospora caninum Liverpool]|eukprot:XP_003886080.1 conserved hypothetical protein [Neospora caninum Liverpool]